MLMKREIRSRLDCIKPSIHLAENLKRNLNLYNQTKTFNIGMRVASRNYFGDKWRFGKVENVLGTLHYLIRLDDGRIVKRHVDQIRKIGENIETDYIEPTIIVKPACVQPLPVQSLSKNFTEITESSSNKDKSLENEQPNLVITTESTIPTPQIRKSSRIIKKPDRLDL
ncbi:hypothetical protein RN001_012441 [Aquatica leii]|uniref:Uncharacterized protein n=1 Tax=Aquatica leii TaxID=1421715 RepID=A0AAN7PSW1_9COLE|nr:hypothetical protein RN001_012441 [Aquatica leii]